MIKKLLVITIFILFLGVSITPSAKYISQEKSSTTLFFDRSFDNVVSIATHTPLLDTIDNRIKDVPINYKSIEYIKNPEVLSTCDHIAYIGSSDFYDCWIYELPLSGGFSECICYETNSYFFSGGTCIADDKILVCEYGSGQLYEIDLENCELTCIGGGGIGLNGLTYDPVYDILYGTSSSSLFEINPQTGSLTLIGNYNIGYTMISIACDVDGALYGWDVKFSGESYLYKINTETGEATVVGGMGMNLCYAQDGDFCKEDDILYLAAYNTGGSYLCICDKETGELTILGQFSGNPEITIFAIPGNFPPYVPSNPYPSDGATGVPINTILSWTGGDPDGDFVRFDVYFGNSTPPPKVASYHEKTTYYPGSLENCTKYYWQIVARDWWGVETEGPIWNFTSNCGPDAPTIDGPIEGKPGEVYDYSFVSNDPEGDDVRYIIDWLTTGEYILTSYYKSGEEIVLPYFFTKSGTFTISAMAEDSYGAESEWGTLTLTISKNKFLNNFLFFSFLDRHSYIQDLLEILGRNIKWRKEIF